MPRWLLRLVGLFGGEPRGTPHRREMQAPRRSFPIVPLPEHSGEGSPPRLHWKASHPSTITRFKAQMTCARGHGIALRDHSVEADGRVFPSVVCNAPGCDFHEYVRLEGWSAGQILSPVAEAFRRARA